MVCEPEDRTSMAGVIDLMEIPEIRGVQRMDGGGLEIGAATTFAEIRRAPEIRGTYPSLAAAASVVGGLQIQNRATLGGNVANASPAGDSLPVLLSLDAVVVAVGPKGRREIPYGEFHTGYRKTALNPAEIIGWIRLPAAAEHAAVRFRKVGTRGAQAISKVVLAVSAVRPPQGPLTAVRIAAGSVAPVPVRLREAERICEGREPGRDLADRAGDAAAAEIHPIDDVRSTADYRRFALCRLVRRMILSLPGGAGGAGVDRSTGDR
jgi:CO/xanthine dehydrogenase FAD-binding subunit